MNIIAYLPIFTTIFCLFFSFSIFKRYGQKKGLHLLWWSVGVFLFGVGTLTESLVTLFGWHEITFRMWYISGALLGAAPLAQGTVYLLLKRKTAHILTVILLLLTTVAAVCVCLTPLDYQAVEKHRLFSGIIIWKWVRLFSPVINIYALLFLVGGAIFSACRFYGKKETSHRFVGNVFIAIGALLPGIGGASARFGYTEVLYVTELVGILLIFVGYFTIAKKRVD